MQWHFSLTLSDTALVFKWYVYHILALVTIIFILFGFREISYTFGQKPKRILKKNNISTMKYNIVPFILRSLNYENGLTSFKKEF